MLPDIHRATQKFYIFLIVYLTGCTPNALDVCEFMFNKPEERKEFELICVQEDKAADIMLKVVACARILYYNTGGQEEYIYETIKMAFSNRPILQNLFG